MPASIEEFILLGRLRRTSKGVVNMRAVPSDMCDFVMRRLMPEEIKGLTITALESKGRDYDCTKCGGTVRASVGKVRCAHCGHIRPLNRKSPETARDREYKRQLRKSLGLV